MEHSIIELIFFVTINMEGPWVGTWRPHPRRGPILAEFSTPGPKYWIPGTTGHASHDPTRDKAPAYTFRGAKGPVAENCSPGPRYFIHPSITKIGKYVPPSAHLVGRPKTKSEVTPGPSDYSTDKADKHVYYNAPVQTMVFRHKLTDAFQTPGPAAYTLPRLLGPHTVYTHASPCYSMRFKSMYNSCFQDLAKTPGPAAFPKVELDVYKKRAPKYTMGLKTKLSDKTLRPGPADYCVGKVTLIKPREPAYTFGLRHSLYKAALLPRMPPE